MTLIDSTVWLIIVTRTWPIDSTWCFMPKSILSRINVTIIFTEDCTYYVRADVHNLVIISSYII